MQGKPKRQEDAGALPANRNKRPRRLIRLGH